MPLSRPSNHRLSKIELDSVSPSAAGTFRWVTQPLQRRRDRVAMVALDFEAGILDRAACAEIRFQLFEERLPLLLR